MKKGDDAFGRWDLSSSLVELDHGSFLRFHMVPRSHETGGYLQKLQLSRRSRRKWRALSSNHDSSTSPKTIPTARHIFPKFLGGPFLPRLCNFCFQLSIQNAVYGPITFCKKAGNRKFPCPPCVR